MRLLKEAELEHAAELVNEVVTKASGVFLWVTLVVKSLLKGLRNRDSIDDLRRRLRDLPADLNTFYTHMLNHIEPLYREQTSRTFQIFETLLVGRRDFSVTALELELGIKATPENTLLNIWKPMAEEEIQSRIEGLDVHLKSRCDGLLEIHDIYTFRLDINCSATVRYLHRTVREFLQTEAAKSLISNGILSRDFLPELSITMSYVTMLKRKIISGKKGLVALQNYTNYDIWASMNDAMEYARGAEAAGRSEYSSMVDELSRAGLRMWSMDTEPSQPVFSRSFHLHPPGESWITCNKPQKWQRYFIGLAIQHGLVSYVEKKVKDDKFLVLEQHEIPLLLYALFPGTQYVLTPWAFEMINILLRYGANPNQLWHGNSPWQYTLTYVHQKCLPYKAALLTVMLMHGANPFSTCRQNHTVAGYLALSQHHPAHSVQAIVEDISSSLGSSEALDLRHVLQYYMSLWQACPGTKKCKDDDLERRPQRKSSRR